MLGGHISTSIILMTAGAIANHMKSLANDQTFFEKIKNGDLFFVQTALKCNPNFLNQTDELGFNLLHYAAESGQIKIVRYLIAMGADVNIKSQRLRSTYYEMTALDILLHMAQYDHIAILLFDAGANISPAIDGKYHLIHLAAKNGYLGVVKKLVAQNPGFVHVKDAMNQTPLLWAASRGQDDIVAFLISQGADVNVTTKSETHISHHSDYSALDWAIIGGHSGCISILARAGAFANKQISAYEKELGKAKYLFFNTSVKIPPTTATYIDSHLEPSETQHNMFTY